MKTIYDFSRLTLISSAGCNLSCKYCVISQNKTSQIYSNKMQQNIIQSFKDNTFLQNTKDIYNFFEQDYSVVQEINLWGQEPTLTLPYFGQNIKDWLDTYYNWHILFLSTNMGTDPKLLLNFIKDLDNALTHKFHLIIQISYDGEYSCLHERGIDTKIIKSHYLSLISELNNFVLKNLNISFSMHGVINFNTIYNIINDDQLLIEYITDLDNTKYFLSSNIHNIGCNFIGCSLVLEQPHQTSVMDGQILNLFLQKLQIISSDLSLHFLNPIYDFLLQLSRRCHCDRLWQEQISNELNISYNPFNTSLFQNNISEFLSCGVFANELKITYNGILLNCLNNIFNTDIQFLNTNNQIDFTILKSLIEHKYYIMPLKENNQNNITNIFNIYNGIQTAFLTMYQSTINLMILLAQDKQILNNYNYDNKKLLRHAYYINCFQYCVYNRVIQSSSHYLSSIYVCRLLCNGVLDLVDEYFIENEDQIWNDINQIIKKY